MLLPAYYLRYGSLIATSDFRLLANSASVTRNDLSEEDRTASL